MIAQLIVVALSALLIVLIIKVLNQNAKPSNLENYLSTGVHYDPEEGAIIHTDSDALLLQIRGWAAFNKLERENLQSTTELQDKFGHLVADAINQKMLNS